MADRTSTLARRVIAVVRAILVGTAVACCGGAVASVCLRELDYAARLMIFAMLCGVILFALREATP